MLPLYQYNASEDNTQCHTGNETHKLHMESRKQKCRKYDSGPCRFENLDKKFLQYAPEKKLFADSGQCADE